MMCVFDNLHGIYQLVPADDADAKFKSFLQALAPAKQIWDRKIDRYYKHVSQNYYLVFSSDSKQCHFWNLIDFGKKCGIDKGIFYENVLIQKSNGVTDIISIDSIIQNETYFQKEISKKLIEEIRNLSVTVAHLSSRNKETIAVNERNWEFILKQQSIIDTQQQHEKLQKQEVIEQKGVIHNLTLQNERFESANVLKDEQRVMKTHKIEIDELPVHNQKELESKNQAIIVYIIIISILGIVCLVSIIIMIYHCILVRKSRKNRVQNINFYQRKPEPQIHHVIGGQRGIRKKSDATAMGRFEPERFSDAIHNLPAVQDAVLDGIIDEMETEEGRNNNSETVND